MEVQTIEYQTNNTAYNSLILKSELKSHYYPFGLKHQGYNNYPAESSQNNKYKYQYNGKEWNDDLRYNMNEMGSRHYDPAIARWTTQDPVTHYSLSLYNAFDNNPIFWADPSGGDSTDVIGAMTWASEQTDPTNPENYGGWREASSFVLSQWNFEKKDGGISEISSTLEKVYDDLVHAKLIKQNQQYLYFSYVEEIRSSDLNETSVNLDASVLHAVSVDSKSLLDEYGDKFAKWMENHFYLEIGAKLTYGSHLNIGYKHIEDINIGESSTILELSAGTAGNKVFESYDRFENGSMTAGISLYGIGGYHSKDFANPSKTTTSVGILGVTYSCTCNKASGKSKKFIGYDTAASFAIGFGASANFKIGIEW